MEIKLEERAGNLVITTPKLVLTIEPVNAKLGASMLAQTLNLSLDGGVDMSEEDMESLYEHAMGKENIDTANNTLRLPVFQTVVHCALFWQTTGLDAAEAFIVGGVGKALGVHLDKMGLSLSQILSLMAGEEKTPVPDDTNDTSIPPTFAAKSKAPESPKKKSAPASNGGKSSRTGKKPSATSTKSTESTGETTP